MPNQPGAYLGRIRSVEDLRQRCHVDPECGCWIYAGRCDSVSLLMADGRVISRRIRRAALIVARDFRDLPKGMQAYPARHCPAGDDCANPQHTRMGSRRQALQEHARRGAYSAPERIATLMRSSQARRRVTPEMDLAIAQETGKLGDIAQKYGISVSRVKVAKAGGYGRKAPVSVFEWRP